MSEIVEIQGIRLIADPAVLSDVILTSLGTGRYEKGEAKYLPRLVEPGERLLELGGGIGFLSALVSATGLSEAIVVVEAHPDLIPVIRRNHETNRISSIVIHGAVVRQRIAETAEFRLHPHFWASSLEPTAKAERVVSVPTVALADLLAEHRPTLLIVDVEGSEVDLLQDANLPGVNKVLVELHHKVIGPEGVRRVFRSLMDAGFSYDTQFSHEAVVLFRRLH